MPKQEFIMKLLRFGLVGGTVTLVLMGLTKLFTGWWGNQVGFLVAYPFALTLHFLLNKWWTFGSQRRDNARQVSEYLLMAGVTFLIQWAIYSLVIHYTRITPAFATVIANAAQMVITFVAMDRRVFASPSKTV